MIRLCIATDSDIYFFPTILNNNFEQILQIKINRIRILKKIMEHGNNKLKQMRNISGLLNRFNSMCLSVKC